MFTTSEFVTVSMCNTEGNLSTMGKINIIQDAAASELGRLGCDNITLKTKYNAMWVFIKNKIMLLKELKWNEEFTVSAFISAYTKITVSVDIVFTNKNNEVALYSKLEVCPLDAITHKIKRISSVGFPLDYASKPSFMEVTFTKNDVLNYQYVKSIMVESQSIDFSHHTNNAEYLRFILNTYPVSMLEQKKIKEIEIHYLKESKEGDTLCIFKENKNSIDYFSIQRKEDIIAKINIIF